MGLIKSIYEIWARPTVSELGASESNEGDGSSLKSSGTSDLDVAVSSLGALTPFGSNGEFGISFAFVFRPGLEDNTGTGITSHERGEGMVINSCLSRINLFLVTSINSLGLLECKFIFDEVFAIGILSSTRITIAIQINFEGLFLQYDVIDLTGSSSIDNLIIWFWCNFLNFSLFLIHISLKGGVIGWSSAVLVI